MAAIARRALSHPSGRLIALIALVTAVIALSLAALAGGGGASDEATGELAVASTTLRPGVIELELDNRSDQPVRISQLVLNDAFVPFSGAEGPIAAAGSDRIAVRERWIEGQAYTLTLLTSDGATIEHEIDDAQPSG